MFDRAGRITHKCSYNPHCHLDVRKMRTYTCTHDSGIVAGEPMWIISKSRLRDFWQKADRADSKQPLLAWYTVVSKARWTNFAALKATYPNASLVGDCVVFNIHGNKYRLVARVRFLLHKVFVLRIMTHKQYDQTNWKDECGCFAQNTAHARQPQARPREQ